MSHNTPAPANSFPIGAAVGFLSNGGKRRYLAEVESTTGFVAFRIADGPVLVSNARQVSLKTGESVAFWSCASYTDPTPAGRIVQLDCHDNGLTQTDIRALTGLRYLDCSFNSLDALSLDGLTELEVLDADMNRLTGLDVHDLAALRVLNCASNRLTTLGLGEMPSLEVLDCSHNPMKGVVLDGCSSLRDCKLPGRLTRQ